MKISMRHIAADILEGWIEILKANRFIIELALQDMDASGRWVIPSDVLLSKREKYRAHKERLKRIRQRLLRKRLPKELTLFSLVNDVNRAMKDVMLTKGELDRLVRNCPKVRAFVENL